jgi:hypothetical protein
MFGVITEAYYGMPGNLKEMAIRILNPYLEGWIG